MLFRTSHVKASFSSNVPVNADGSLNDKFNLFVIHGNIKTTFTTGSITNRNYILKLTAWVKKSNALLVEFPEI